MQFQLSDDVAFRGDAYVKGCQEYLESSMALCRLLRNRIPLTDEKLFTSQGDYALSAVPFSQRLEHIRSILSESAPQLQRRNLRTL